ncbi:MAG TPA: hypothetical protein VKV05_13585 [Terriglobales bacterium]|nr:hypothetical protein [Terriglobales bacterium]
MSSNAQGALPTGAGEAVIVAKNHRSCPRQRSAVTGIEAQLKKS